MKEEMLFISALELCKVPVLSFNRNPYDGQICFDYFTEKGILTKTDDNLPVIVQFVQQYMGCLLISSKTEVCQSQSTSTCPGARLGRSGRSHQSCSCLIMKTVPLLRIKPLSQLSMATMFYFHKCYQDNLIPKNNEVAQLGPVTQRTLEKVHKMSYSREIDIWRERE